VGFASRCGCGCCCCCCWRGEKRSEVAPAWRAALEVENTAPAGRGGVAVAERGEKGAPPLRCGATAATAAADAAAARGEKGAAIGAHGPVDAAAAAAADRGENILPGGGGPVIPGLGDWRAAADRGENGTVPAAAGGAVAVFVGAAVAEVPPVRGENGKAAPGGPGGKAAADPPAGAPRGENMAVGLDAPLVVDVAVLCAEKVDGATDGGRGVAPSRGENGRAALPAPLRCGATPEAVVPPLVGAPCKDGGGVCGGDASCGAGELRRELDGCCCCWCCC